MTAIPTGISEAHEVEVHLTCDAGQFRVAEQHVEKLTAALREAKSAILEGDADRATRAVNSAAATVGDLEEQDGGVCSFDGTVEGYYLDEDSAEATCPVCWTVHEVPV